METRACTDQVGLSPQLCLAEPPPSDCCPSIPLWVEGRVVTLGLSGDPGAEQVGTRLSSRLRSKRGGWVWSTGHWSQPGGSWGPGQAGWKHLPQETPWFTPHPATLLGPFWLLGAHAASRKPPWFPAPIAWSPRAPVGSRCLQEAPLVLPRRHCLVPTGSCGLMLHSTDPSSLEQPFDARVGREGAERARLWWSPSLPLPGLNRCMRAGSRLLPQAC